MNNFKLPIKFEAILYSKKNNLFKFLLIKRIPKDGGFWQPVTGTLESNESFFDCMYREIEEEINIKKDQIISVTEMIYEFTWLKNKNINITEYVFGVEIPSNLKIILSDEHNDYKWCSYYESLELMEKENNKKAFAAFKDKVAVIV